MSRTSEACYKVRLTALESYIEGLRLPVQVEGRIYHTSVPQSLLFAKMELFLFESDKEGGILDIFPLFMFRTKEESSPHIGDIKEFRLLSLQGRNGELSLNSYIKGNAVVLAAL
jgi:hypothetical protein